jgi:hypothetical protein
MGTPPAAVRAAVQAVMCDPALAGVRDALLLDGVEILPDSDYKAFWPWRGRRSVPGIPHSPDPGGGGMRIREIRATPVNIAFTAPYRCQG